MRRKQPDSKAGLTRKVNELKELNVTLAKNYNEAIKNYHHMERLKNQQCERVETLQRHCHTMETELNHLRGAVERINNEERRQDKKELFVNRGFDFPKTTRETGQNFAEEYSRMEKEINRKPNGCAVLGENTQPIPWWAV